MAITSTEDISTVFVWAATNAKSVLVDNVSATLAYVGVAGDTTDTSIAVFTVFKFVFNLTGLITSVTRATGVAWDNRTTASYI